MSVRGVMQAHDPADARRKLMARMSRMNMTLLTAKFLPTSAEETGKINMRQVKESKREAKSESNGGKSGGVQGESGGAVEGSHATAPQSRMAKRPPSVAEPRPLTENAALARRRTTYKDPTEVEKFPTPV